MSTGIGIIERTPASKRAACLHRSNAAAVRAQQSAYRRHCAARISIKRHIKRISASRSGCAAVYRAKPYGAQAHGKYQKSSKNANRARTKRGISDAVASGGNGSNLDSTSREAQQWQNAGIIARRRNLQRARHIARASRKSNIRRKGIKITQHAREESQAAAAQIGRAAWKKRGLGVARRRQMALVRKTASASSGWAQSTGRQAHARCACRASRGT